MHDLTSLADGDVKKANSVGDDGPSYVVTVASRGPGDDAGVTMWTRRSVGVAAVTVAVAPPVRDTVSLVGSGMKFVLKKERKGGVGGRGRRKGGGTCRRRRRLPLPAALMSSASAARRQRAADVWARGTTR